MAIPRQRAIAAFAAPTLKRRTQPQAHRDQHDNFHVGFMIRRLRAVGQPLRLPRKKAGDAPALQFVIPSEVEESAD